MIITLNDNNKTPQNIDKDRVSSIDKKDSKVLNINYNAKTFTGNNYEYTCQFFYDDESKLDKDIQRIELLLK